jgi:CDP-glycerol glycerophosphotransferase (TagB/SpsB family)
MVFSYYLSRGPYSFVWRIMRMLRRLTPVVFYCGDPLDYYVFEPINKYLGNVPYVADKHKIRAFLHAKGVPYSNLPVFPQTVIMARHATHKFPCRQIKKVGLRHGAYHFKRMISSKSYNQFDLYLMTSRKDVEAGKLLGITCARSVGFPKLDPAFNGQISPKSLQDLKKKICFANEKPILLFSATYDASGMSALNLWCNRLSQLTSKYNVMVTLHSFVKFTYKDTIRATPRIYYIRDYFVLPYIMVADVIIGDTSSILAECCALDKPIITFSTPRAKRTIDEIDVLINSISYRIKAFEEIFEMIEHALSHKDELSENRAKANAVFFENLDGQAGERAAEAIKELITQGE